MIQNNEKLVVYLESTVSNVFKILPLYEEENIGLDAYVDSLLRKMCGLDKVVVIDHGYEYISILSILEVIKMEVLKEESDKAIIKREVFNCINVIKNMIGKLQEGA